MIRSTRNTIAIVLAAGLVALAAIVLAGAVASGDARAQPNVLTQRVVAVNLAADGNASDVPPPDPSYCAGSSSAPPNSVIGRLTFAGQPAPTGTLVQLTFDGKVGPGERTWEPGGYGIAYAIGDVGCGNQPGAAIGVLVDGVPYDAGVVVGAEAAVPLFFFHIHIP